MFQCNEKLAQSELILFIGKNTYTENQTKDDKKGRTKETGDVEEEGDDDPGERRGSRDTSGRDEGLPSQASQKLAKSNKLEDQINLQHLVELMRIFHVQ